MTKENCQGQILIEKIMPVEKTTDIEHEEFLHDDEFFVEKDGDEKLVSIKRRIDFDEEFPKSIQLDKYPESPIVSKNDKDKIENDRVDKIFSAFKEKEEELKKQHDNKHIFLLAKKHYIEGIGRDKKYKGFLKDDVLATINKEHKDRYDLIKSFNEKNSDRFYITYKTGEDALIPLEKRFVRLVLKTKISSLHSDYIDLTKKVNDVSDLRNLLAKR